MRLSTPGTAREGVTRRELLGTATLGAAFGLAAMVGHQPGSKPHNMNGSKLILPDGTVDMKQKLDMNAEEFDKLWSMGPEAYMADLRRRGQRLLAESDPNEEKLECVDERQMDGVTDCLAGLGVHIPDQRPAVARETIDSALAKYEARRGKGNQRPVKIRLTWHGDGMCGAALLACKQGDATKQKVFTPAEIDQKAQLGALLLQGEIVRQLTAMGKAHTCQVVVEQVPSNKVLKPDGHPGKVVLLNADPKLEFNRTEDVPLLTYGASVNVFDSHAVSDAVLSGRIMMGAHGKNHVYGGHNKHEHGAHEKLAERDKPYYLVVGPVDLALKARGKLVDALKVLPEADQDVLAGKIELYPTNGRN